MRVKLAVGLVVLVACGAARAETAANGTPPYVTPADVPLLQLLPPPPAPGSAEEKADLQAVAAAQAARTPATSQDALEDSVRTVFRFTDAIGPGFTKERLPTAAPLFREVFDEEERIVDVAKDHWNRKRPFMIDPDLHPIIYDPKDGGKPTGQSPGYPSGHAAFASVEAVLLANMMPEKAPAIFARAARFEHNRIVAGVHYPTDVQAGIISGTLIANALLHNARFMADFTRARTEVRQAVGLP
jgi:acid phosphatase (class A)